MNDDQLGFVGKKKRSGDDSDDSEDGIKAIDTDDDDDSDEDDKFSCVSIFSFAESI